MFNLVPLMQGHAQGLFEAGNKPEIWTYMFMNMRSFEDTEKIIGNAIDSMERPWIPNVSTYSYDTVLKPLTYFVFNWKPMRKTFVHNEQSKGLEQPKRGFCVNIVFYQTALCEIQWYNLLRSVMWIIPTHIVLCHRMIKPLHSQNFYPITPTSM